MSVENQGWDGVTDANGDFDFGEHPLGFYKVTGQIDPASAQASQTLLAPAGSTTQFTLIFCVVTTEIQINNTAAANDDLVQLKCDHPSHRHKVPCRIKVASATHSDHRITLGNPDGHLRFPDAGNTTKDLTLPASQAWVAFEISGETGSHAIGDATIEVRLAAACPGGGASRVGDLRGTKNVTVFWFDNARMTLTRGGNYALTAGGQYTVSAGNAVSYSSTATIKPAGVDCSAPQVTNLRIGIMQESSLFASVTTWNAPAIAWSAGVASGAAVTVPTTITETTTYDHGRIAEPVADTDANCTPLYDQPGKATTLDANSLKPPNGCAGAGPATSFDTPSQGAPATRTAPARVGAAVVGVVTWTRLNTVRREHFRTFCVVFNTSTNVFCALREATWDLNCDSAGPPVAQHAQVHGDGPATASPATGIDANSAPTSVHLAPVGAATTRFVAP